MSTSDIPPKTKLTVSSPNKQLDLTLEQFKTATTTLNGTFEAEVEWCSDPSLDDWKQHFLQITKTGSLIHKVDGQTMLNSFSIQNIPSTLVDDGNNPNTANKLPYDSTNNDTSENNAIINVHPIIKHLQGCQIQLIDNDKYASIPIIKVITSLNKFPIYIRTKRESTFQELFASLIWWSALKKKGIFEKLELIKPKITENDKKTHRKEPTNLLVCQFNVFGPISRKTNLRDDRYNIIPDTNQNFPLQYDTDIDNDKLDNFGWFKAMGVLKSNGTLDLLLKSDGSLIYSLDVSILLRSEIRILDRSILHSDSCLFLGIIPKLRESLGIPVEYNDNNNKQQFIINDMTLANQQRQEVILKCPLRIDLEDWFVALNSFAIAETLSLTNMDNSNRLRVANHFSISVLEANIKIDANVTSDVSLSCHFSMWDHVWMMTPEVRSSQNPFWREEYDLNEDITINSLKITIKKRHANNKQSPVGYVEITQDMINNPEYAKEIRLPLHSSIGVKEIGTICIRIASSDLNFVLPQVNFVKFEQSLLKIDLSKIVKMVYNNPSVRTATDNKLSHTAKIFLEVFQSLNRQHSWFQALVNQELLMIDSSITKTVARNASSAHIFNSIFRGNSLLTKSMELYFLKVGAEYLDKSIGQILRKITKENKLCELDPQRINSKSKNESETEKIIEENYQQLVFYIKKIWKGIYMSSNDLPLAIKSELKSMRKKIEIMNGNTKNDASSDEQYQTILNCISSFLFLRFFCPVILNPKLFYFVADHLTENSRRTLTLISKILLKFSTLSYFGQQEPHLMKINEFISSNREKLFDYIDKVTEKKLDFSPKHLKLNERLTRPKLLMNKEILKNLPAIPYLIDSCLRESQLIEILMTTKSGVDGNNSNRRCSDEHLPEIGELEFEKLTENNTEIFGNDLMQYLEEEDDNEPDNGVDGNKRQTNSSSRKETSVIVRDFDREASLLFNKLERLKNLLSDYEYPSDTLFESKRYSELLAKRIYFSETKELYISDDKSAVSPPTNMTRLYTSSNETRIRFFNNERILTRSQQSPIHPSNKNLNRNSYQFEKKSNYDAENTVDTQNKGLSRLTSIKLSKMIRKTTEVTNANVENSNNKKGWWFTRK